MPPQTCPNCGSDVPLRAKACPECGSDETTGWSDDAHVESLGLPDQDFNYEEYVQREFGGKPPQAKRGKLWAIVALVILLAFALSIFRWFL